METSSSLADSPLPVGREGGREEQHVEYKVGCSWADLILIDVIIVTACINCQVTYTDCLAPRVDTTRKVTAQQPCTVTFSYQSSILTITAGVTVSILTTTASILAELLTKTASILY